MVFDHFPAISSSCRYVVMIFVLLTRNISIFEYLSNFLEISYNRPKLSPSATWNRSETIFVSKDITVNGLFINKNNTIYAPADYHSFIYEWQEDNINSTRIIYTNLLSLSDLFVRTTGNIYISSILTDQVERLSLNGNISEKILFDCLPCYRLFISINDILYCSMLGEHQIVTKSLHIETNILTVVAGVGFRGSESNMLYLPQGIFVNINLDLYVADSGNDRIQLFRSGQFNGSTVAATFGTITLNEPTSVVLDADDYLYITEYDNHRIVRWGSIDVQCIVGCEWEKGSSSNQLVDPERLAFDSFGHITVGRF